MTVYVDDIVLTRDENVELASLKEKLYNTFQINDLRPLKSFLGMEFDMSKKQVVI